MMKKVIPAGLAMRAFMALLVLCVVTPVATGGIFFPAESALSEGKRAALTTANLIYQRFDLARLQQLQFFMSLMNMPTTTWDIIKYKIVTKLLQGGNFTMVFGGTSVTAGYDNYLHQSYPMIVERRLTPVFSALGSRLIVRNIAQNHMDCKLSNYCFVTMGGGDADFVGWENSFDCGNAPDAHEFIARVAGWQGAVVHYSVSGSFPLDDCPPSKDKVPHISEQWTPQSTGVVVLDTNSVRDFRQLHQAWHDMGPSAGRFTKALEASYNGVGAHGFSLWTKTEAQCDYGAVDSNASSNGRLYPVTARRRILQEVQGGAPHNMKRKSAKQRGHGEAAHEGISRQRGAKARVIVNGVSGIREVDNVLPCEPVKLKGACAADGGPRWRTLEAAQFGYTQQAGRKWHPSKGMHMLRAEVLTYTYLHIILDAIYEIEDAKKTTTSAALKGSGAGSHLAERKKSSWYSFFGGSAAKEHISHATDAAALAYLQEVQAKLRALQVPVPTEPLQCDPEECRLLPRCYTNAQPNYSPDKHLRSILVGAHMGWYEEAALANDLHPELGLLDKKFYYKSEGAKNEIHFQLRGVRGAVRVYARSKKEPISECVFLLDPHINVMDDAAAFPTPKSYRPTSKRYLLTQDILVASAGEWVHISGIPEGDHVLTVMTSPTNPFVIATLAHIVVF